MKEDYCSITVAHMRGVQQCIHILVRKSEEKRPAGASKNRM